MTDFLTLAAGNGFSTDAVAQLFLAIAIILGAARLLGEVFRHFGQPPIVGEILAGILLGKTVLYRVSPDLYQRLLGDGLDPAAQTGLLAILTVSAALLLLVAGLEVDLGAIRRELKATVLVSVSSMLLPFVVGFVVAWFLPSWLGEGDTENRLVLALFIGVALSITALPVIAKILMDLGLQRSDLGIIILASAVVNDLIGWIGFASVLALAGVDGNNNLWFTIGLTVLFAGICLTIGRKLAGPALTWIQAHGGWPTGVLSFVFVLTFLAAAFTEWIGVHAIFGAFLAGVLFADTGRLRERTQQSIEDIVGAVFAPIFFAFIALNVDFIGNFDLLSTVVVLIIAIVGKLFGGCLGARLAKLGERESWAIGAGMTARGAMEIILGGLALEAGIIGDELFVAIVIMSLVTSIAAGPAIEWILARKADLTLNGLINTAHIISDLKAESPEAAIREMGRVAKLKLTWIEHIVERELDIPTGLPGNLALPHSRLEGLSKPMIVIGISRAGIDFGTPDGSESYLIVMVLSPKGQNDVHLRVLNLIARVLQHKDVRDEILAATTATEVKAAINHKETTQSDH